MTQFAWYKTFRLSFSQVTGDPKWVVAGINGLAEQCLIHVNLDVELWVNVSGIFMPEPEIISKICLNDCSGLDQGTCTNGRHLENI